MIKKNYVTKYLEILAEIAELNAAYRKFYEQFGERLKLGNDEDSTVGVKTAEVLRFNTSKLGDEQSSFEEYIDRMKEGQTDISYITGESIAVVSSSPFVENLRKKGLEELHVTDPMDEYAVHQPKEFDGKMLKSTTKEGLDLGDEDEKKTLEELKAEFKPLTELMKEVPGDKVEEAIVDDRTVDCLRVLTTSGHGLPVDMERIMKVLGDTVEEAPERQQHSSKRSTATRVEEERENGEKDEEEKEVEKGQEERDKGERRKERRKEKGEKVGGEEWETVAVKGRKGQRERGQEGRKNEEGKEAEEGGGEEVKKDVTGWTVVTRKQKPKRRMIQIYVKVNGGRVIPTEVNLTDDKVEDLMRQIPSSEDMYVTMHGRVLKRSEKLKSCEVTDGCTIQVTSRLRGGGRSKNKTAGEKKKKSPKKVEQNDRGTEEKNLTEVDTIAEMLERISRTGVGGWSAEMMEATVGMDDEQTERMLRMLRSNFTEEVGGDPEMMIGGMKKFVQERKRRREVQREEETGEAEEKQEKEVRTGRGNAGLVRGEDERCRGSEASGKGKGKGYEGKGEHGKEGGRGGKGARQKIPSEEDEEDDRVQVAPNTGAGGSHPRTTTDPRKEKKETRVLSWADCNDEEVEENEEEVEEEKETGQQEMTDERPPGLEEVESEPKTREEEKPTQVESEQEAQEEEQRRAQEAREEEKKAQEARELKRAQEAREEERRAQEAREQKRAQEAREEERRAQEAREEETRAQKAREEEQRRAREAREEEKAQEMRREKRVQEAREKEAKAQEE